MKNKKTINKKNRFKEKLRKNINKYLLYIISNKIRKSVEKKKLKKPDLLWKNW